MINFVQKTKKMFIFGTKFLTYTRLRISRIYTNTHIILTIEVYEVNFLAFFCPAEMKEMKEWTCLWHLGNIQTSHFCHFH